jgi:2-dehydro-3-deoxygluconokinase
MKIGDLEIKGHVILGPMAGVTTLAYREFMKPFGVALSYSEMVSDCGLVYENKKTYEYLATSEVDRPVGIQLFGFDAEKTGGEIDQNIFISVGQQLMAKFPRCKKVAVTLRGSINANHNTWGGVLYDGKTLWQSRRYDITHIVDRVGGGDSFMGGLLYGLISYSTDQEAIEFAAAASALKHTIIGDYNRVTVAEVEGLIKGGGSGRVSR